MNRDYRIACTMHVVTNVDNIDDRLMRDLVFDQLDDMCDRFDDVESVDGFELWEVTDEINPDHYRKSLPFEAIELCEMLSFCQGNAVKYVCRAGAKPGVPWRTDIEKARWYVRRELHRLDGRPGGTVDAARMLDDVPWTDDGVKDAKLACLRSIVHWVEPLKALDVLEEKLGNLLG